MSNTNKGFTLVELLVVISIIALLLAVLVPALNVARSRAHTLVCATNLKSYGTALNAYAMANNEKAPFVTTWLYSAETLTSWGSGYEPPYEYAGLNVKPSRGGGGGNVKCPSGCRRHYDVDPPDGSLWPYLKNLDAHMCPTFKSYAKNGLCPCSAHSVTLPYNPTYSYSMNYFLGVDWATGLSITMEKVYEKELSLPLTMVKRASNCFAFSEENLWTIPGYSDALLNDNALWPSPDPARNIDNFATYHNVNKNKRNEGKANAVFVDGHAETLRGLPYDGTYMEYARPYNGHESLRLW